MKIHYSKLFNMPHFSVIFFLLLKEHTLYISFAMTAAGVVPYKISSIYIHHKHCRLCFTIVSFKSVGTFLGYILDNVLP